MSARRRLPIDHSRGRRGVLQRSGASVNAHLGAIVGCRNSAGLHRPRVSRLSSPARVCPGRRPVWVGTAGTPGHGGQARRSERRPAPAGQQRPVRRLTLRHRLQKRGGLDSRGRGDRGAGLGRTRGVAILPISAGPLSPPAAGRMSIATKA